LMYTLAVCDNTALTTATATGHWQGGLLRAARSESSFDPGMLAAAGASPPYFEMVADITNDIAVIAAKGKPWPSEPLKVAVSSARSLRPNVCVLQWRSCNKHTPSVCASGSTQMWSERRSKRLTS
jgi:hypothetical protein